MKKEKIDILSDEVIQSKIKVDSITDELYGLKEALIQGMSKEDTDATNIYFNEVIKGLLPAAEKINKILENEQSRMILANGLKNAIKDNEWQEKLLKTSFSHMLEHLPETK
jgi:hypothetical protein